MARVQLEDIFQAELWTSDMFLEAPLLKNILTSGLLVESQEIKSIVNAVSAGSRFEMPYVEEPNFTEPTAMDESDNYAPTTKISWANQFAIISMVNKNYEYNHLANTLNRDSDPAKVFRDEVIGRFWATDMQNRIIHTVRGLIAKAGAELVLDVADDSTDGADVTLSPSIIIDGVAKQGDNQDKFGFMFMHSKVYADLKKQKLIDTVLPNDNSLQKFEMYGGYRIIVNDAMPVEQGENKKKYTTLIAQNGLIAYADKDLGKEMPVVELVRNALIGNGSGRTTIATRRGLCLHPIGWSYNKSVASPTYADLSNSANWTMKFKPKQQKFVAIITN